MNTPTEILIKRTCERVKIGVDEHQRIHFFKIMSIRSLLRKFDAMSITDILVSVCPADGIANRYPDELTRLKSAL